MKEINNRAEELIQNIHTSIVRWYPFKPDSDIVYIGGEDAILCWLKEQYGKHVNSINPDIIFENSIESVGKADYIVSIATPEQIQNPGILLSWMRTHLKSTGRLILGMNNRLGIRYFCGDRDLYTERNFDGIEDYFRAYKSPDDRFVGRAYDRAQLTEMLTRAGFDDQKFYSVFSDLGNASFLFADGYVPNEELQIRIFPTYNSSSTVFLEEERLYTALLKNGLFHEMANAFLIECSLDGAHTDALQVTGSLDRGREDALITIIHENGTVTKKAPFQEGTEKLSRLNDNMKYLQSKGVNVVPGELNGDIYTMPLINAETGMVYLQRLLSENPDLFLQKMDESLKAAVGAGCSKIIVHPIFACIGPDEEWEVNRSFYLSLNSLACELGSDIRILLINSAKDINGHLVRGICAEPEQANKWVDALNEECGRERFDFCFDLGVATLCCQDVYEAVVPIGKRLETVILRDCDGVHDVEMLPYTACMKGQQTDWLSFVRALRKIDFDNELIIDFADTYSQSPEMIRPHVLNLAYETGKDFCWHIGMDRLVAKHGKRVLFGAGNMCREYMSNYGDKYPPLFTCDNNPSRWGEEFCGLTIESPEKLRNLSPDTAIYICNMYYREIEKQLRDMDLPNPVEWFCDHYMSTFHMERLDMAADPNQVKGAEVLGFCYDTGHGNLVGIDPYKFIKTLGSRLKVIHMHENDGVADLHQLPFTFTRTRENTSVLDWDGVLRGLKETGFDGVLSFETAPVLDCFPAELKEDVLHLIARTGEYFAKQICCID